MLNVIRHGTPGSARPLVIAHGLFGSGRNWGGIARRLAAARPVLCVDMRNHGDSFWSDAHGYEDMAADLAQVIDAHGGQADLLGHSMGGKAAMATALMFPDRVARLIVADIAPVAYGHAAAQRANIAAMRALDLTGLHSRAEADARLARHLGDPGLRGFFLHSLDLRADPPRWRLNLGVLDAQMDRIVGWPAFAARSLCPTLFVAGGLSDYLRPEHRGAIRALFPAARSLRIPKAAHWLHADRPDAFAQTIDVWLARSETADPQRAAPDVVAESATAESAKADSAAADRAARD